MATLAELEAALKKAHAAGNVEHARAFATAIREMRGGGSAGGVSRTPQEWADAENLPVPGTEWNTPEQPARFQSPIPGGDFMNEAARSFAENIPIVGPLVDRGAQAAGSQLASMIPGVNMTPEELQAQRDQLRARDASEQAIANAAGTVTGTVGPLMAFGTTRLGQQVMGMAGPLWQRIMAGGISGGVISAGDTAARGGSWEDIGNAGKLGVGLGAVFPVAERGLSAVARALMASDADRAAATIATGLERDRVDPRNLPALMQNFGPDAMLIDAGPNMSRQGGAIASLPGEGQTLVRDALVQRNLGTNARIQGDVNQVLGPAPIPSRLAAEIDANRKALSPFYEQALEGARAVDTEGVALTLDSMIVNEKGAAQAAARQIRNMLNVTGENLLDPNPRALLNTRHAIDGILYTDGAMAPLDSNVKRVLQTARREIDAELTAKVPGIKQVDARYSELAQQSQGARTGETVLDSGRGNVIRPAEMGDLMQGGVETIIGPSGVPFRISQGARAEIDRLIGTTGNDVNALKTALKGDGSWNRDKLAQLYGQEKTDQLISILDREQSYQRTYNTVMANSETAARLAAQKDVAPRQFGDRPTGIVDMLMRVPQGIANTAARSRSEAVNKMIVEALMSQPGPELVDRLIAARAANTGKIGSAPVPLLVNQ